MMSVVDEVDEWFADAMWHHFLVARKNTFM